MDARLTGCGGSENRGTLHEMRRIPLTQGLTALVDSRDWFLMSQFSWRASRVKNTWYAKRSVGKKIRYLHQDILQIKAPQEGHHKNGNGLDNRRSNLQVTNRVQNCHGFATKREGTSRYRGVSWCAQQSQWLAHIRVNYVAKHLGRFDSERMAAQARDRAAKKIFGTRAQLNFP